MKTCAFTGHRPNSFPWKYDETARDCVLLKKVLAGQIDALVGEGVTEWLSGMALGTDLWGGGDRAEPQKEKPRSAAPLYSPLRRAGGQVAKGRAGALSLYFAAG